MKDDPTRPAHRTHVTNVTVPPATRQTSTDVLGRLDENGLPENADRSIVELMRDANRPEGQKHIVSESWRSRG